MAEKKTKAEKELSEARKKAIEKAKQNLVPANQRSKEEVRKNSSKGGKKSGEVRREKKNLREAMQEALVTTFTDSKGNKATGMEIIMAGILANLSDPKSRNWGKAMEYAMNLSGMQMTPDQIEMIRADIELTKAKTKAISEANSIEDFEDLTPLANLLKCDEDGNEDSND